MTERTLLRFIVLRTVVATTLFVAALVIQSLVLFTLPLDFLFYLTAFTYGLNILWLGLRRFLPVRANLYCQLFGDILLESGIVYLGGSMEGSFSFLYLITVLSASIYLYRRGGLILASAASIAYGLLVDLQYYGVIPSFPRFGGPEVVPLGRIYYNLVANVFAFYLVAVLASFISERLRSAHEALSSTQARYSDLKALNEAIVSSVSSAVLTGDLHGKVLFQNAGARELFGPVASLTSFFGTLELSFEALKEGIVGTGQVHQREIVLGERTFLCRVSGLYDRDARVIGVLLVLDDITQHKALENELQRQERMAAIGALSAAIAHEIRNPLASISGSVQMLKADAPEGGRERKLVEIIAQETFRLNRIIENFILFARPKPLAKVTYSLTQQLRDFHLLLSASPERAGHEVSLELPAEEIILTADRDMLQQVFWNLVRNSFRAMGTAPGRVAIAARAEDGRARIAFADTGPGVPPGEEERIFEPFSGNFQGGLGVGLALCKRVLTDHGGTIRVASAPGQTVFEVELPLCTAS